MADQTADPKGAPAADPGHRAPSTAEHHFRHPSGRALTIAAVIVVGLIIVFILVGYLPRHSRERDLEARARAAVVADSVPIVNVTRVARADATSDINLPGTLQSNRTGSVYARSSGYVRRWYADIGQHVHAGQTLADIEAPDLDQQLVQSRQTVLNQQATLALNKVNLERWKILYQDSAVTKQELDTYQSGYDASVASVAAAQADVRRLEALVGYEKVSAPFTGVITSRNVENGTFVTGTGTISASLPAGVGGNTLPGAPSTGQLFTISAIDTIRVYVGVPQSYAPSVRSGLPALLEVQELPGRTFVGKVARTAQSVDFSSRTLLTEVDIANPSGVLLPGMYGQVHFQFDRVSPPLLMPGTALIFRLNGPQAAVVGADSVLQFRTLKIGRDFGTVMEVDSGLTDGELIVAQPSDDIRSGQHVHVHNEPQGGAPADYPLNQQIAPPSKGQQGGKTSGQQSAPSKTGPPANGGSTYKPPPEVNEGFPGAPVQGTPAPPTPPVTSTPTPPPAAAPTRPN
jgi:multidrug efflux pump subunit AcrA (membrane-fusion protein)